jgi:methyl-accepting chemotaxis protein
MNKLGITGKIWLSVGVFILGFVFTGILVQVQGLSTEHGMGLASQSLFPAAQKCQAAVTAFERTVKGFGDAVVVQDSGGLDRAAQDGQTAVDALRGVASINGLSPERSGTANKLASDLGAFLSDARTTYSSMLGNSAGMSSDAQGKLQGLAARTEALKAALQSLNQQSSRDLQDQLSAEQSASSRQRWVCLALLVVTLGVSFVVVNLTIRRAITNPILRVIQGVQHAVEGAERASSVVSQSGEVVARESLEQAAHVQETSASVQELSATTGENAKRASEADDLMRRAAGTVEKATASMDDLRASMDMITKSSQQVAMVLKSIDEIAFHTNILALNAAVEAARAGEAGAGFSVVADEVRNLARRAAEAAKKSGEIVEKTIHDVNRGEHLVSVAHSAFREVSDHITSGASAVSHIAASSREQATALTQVEHTLTRIGQVTQNNAGNAEESARAANTMSGQVQATRKHIEELVDVVGIRR